jgi:hypothetical protein
MLAGAMIALGACVKVYPLLAAPFFLIRKRRIRWSFLGGCTATMMVIFALSFGLWGKSTFKPFSMASTRGATFLSPFNALAQLNVDVIQYSTFFMLATLAIFFAIYIIRDIDFPVAVLMGLALPLYFYRVGHVNFWIYVALFTPFLIRYWSALWNEETREKLTIALLTWLGFLNWFQLQAALNCGMTMDTPSRIFRDHGAWPYALVLAFSFTIFIQQLATPAARTSVREGSDSHP